MRLLLLSLRWFGVSAVVSLVLASGAQADRQSYYSSEFLKKYQSNTLNNQELLIEVQKIISTGHTMLGYDKARKLLFGKLYLEEVGGAYAVTDVYCEHLFTDKDFEGKPSLGPGRIPNDGSILNTEHTWPQSRFTGRFSKEQQKSDVHHLFPTDSQMNSHRSNLRFGNVEDEVEDLKCPQGRLGHQREGGIVFEAPAKHRGNAARAIFYFATRYQMKVSPAEEAALRQWHRQDPVDAAEASRNDEIEKAQGNRNPFIDFPDMIDHVDAFKY